MTQEMPQVKVIKWNLFMITIHLVLEQPWNDLFSSAYLSISSCSINQLYIPSICVFYFILTFLSSLTEDEVGSMYHSILSNEFE
jgi:hypothetical protein